MITNIKVINRFHMNLIADNLEKPPSDSFAVISIYSTPEELLFNEKRLKYIHSIGCHYVLSLMFGDANPETEKVTYPFNRDHSVKIISFLDFLDMDDRELMLLAHCDAGISRSGAVATFISNYLDIPFQDEYIKPNGYILRTLNNLIWEEKWND